MEQGDVVDIDLERICREQKLRDLKKSNRQEELKKDNDTIVARAQLEKEIRDQQEALKNAANDQQRAAIEQKIQDLNNKLAELNQTDEARKESETKRDAAIAKASGPVNSSATAMPSGMERSDM